MKIRITKETEDLRPNRNKILPKGREFVCDAELAKEYLKAGVAEVVKQSGQVVFIMKPDQVDDSINEILEQEKKHKK
jgi:hypothetical protein